MHPQFATRNGFLNKKGNNTKNGFSGSRAMNNPYRPGQSQDVKQSGSSVLSRQHSAKFRQ